MNLNEEITAELSRISNEVKAALNGPVSELQAKQIELQAMYTDLAQKAARRGGGDQGGGGQSIDTITKKIADDPNVRLLANGQSKNNVTVQLGGLGFLSKTAVTGATFPGEPARLPGFGNDPRRPLRLLDVLQRIPMSTGSTQYLQLNSYTNAAGYQLSQGSLKPEAALPTTLITAEAATVAHWVPASTQVLDDTPMLEQQIRNLLLFGLADRLERELIAGPGTPGTIGGMALAAAAFTATFAAPADRIGEAAAELALRGWQPSLLLVNPADWFAIQSERIVDGGYVMAAGWSMPPRPNVWGLDVVASAGMTAGTAIVLDAQQVAVLDRQTGTVDIGYINDQFARNMLTIRAECRAQLAVFSPSAVLEVALT